MSIRLPRAAYADMFGPTKGDKVRLADTCLRSSTNRFATSVTIIHQERIGREFSGESDGLALASSEDPFQRWKWLLRARTSNHSGLLESQSRTRSRVRS